MIQSLTWVDILLSLVFSPITLGYLPYFVNFFGEGIVIIDDIFTTGATLDEVIKTLSTATSEPLAAVTLAKVPLDYYKGPIPLHWFRQSHWVIGELREARSPIDRTCQNAAKTYLNRGKAKVKLDQYAAAFRDFDQAIHLQPDHAEAYLNRGKAKVKLDQYAAAISDFDQAIHLKPDDARAYYNRGLSKANLGEHAAAIGDFDQAIHLQPDHAEAYYNRGSVKARWKRTSEAKQDLRTALQLAIQVGDKNMKARAERALRMLDDNLDGNDDIAW